MGRNQISIPYENLKLLNAPFRKEFNEAFQAVLDSGWFVLGNHVESFEREFAEYNGSYYCVGVASGLDALILSLEVLDIPKGSEIIVPSNTYIATILAILRADLTPILVEPDEFTYNLDPKKIVEKITNKTKAILPVHLYGKCCQMDKILAIADEYGLYIIEDSAQAHGSMFTNTKAGNFGTLGAFSFYPTKNLGGLGDGGAIITSDSTLYDKLLYFRNYGSKQKYKNDYIGYNSRLDEIQAAFLSIKLKYLDKINSHKRELAKVYYQNLTGLAKLPHIDEKFYDTYHIFNICTDRRDSLRAYLMEYGIMTEVHYPIPPHQQKAYQHLWNSNFPISTKIHETTLSLPISFFHTTEQIHEVSDKICDFLRK
ncbi:MAG: DegT/DnrJ/EryC1/StrS family aminotransferase [Bdellovibrionales bacterium]|nr:DegT/DnrJ/EryC1/StrS family aminotransferase [Bdellovibrionales bacterium]